MGTVTFSDDFKRDAVAQITERGYKRRPGSYGGKPSVVVGNTLDWQFDVEAPDWVWVTDIACTLIETTKLNAVDPHAWLADTLAGIPDYKITKVDDLLPWRWNG